MNELRRNGYIDEKEYETRRGVLLDKITNVDNADTKRASRPNSRKGLENIQAYEHSSTPRPASRGAYVKGDAESKDETLSQRL